MKKAILTAFALASTLTMPVCAQGFGIQLGPFELNLQGINIPAVRVRHSTDPICYAIAHRNLLEMVMEWDDKVSNNEFKKTIKKVTVQPYLFGKNKDGQPILRGNVVAETLLKEITIKYGEGAEEDRETSERKEEDEGFFSGLFHRSSKEETKKDSVNTINVRKVTHFRVIEGSNFEPPKDYKEIFKEDVAEVICTVSVKDSARQ